MTLNAVWAYFALMTVVMGIAALPPFRFVDNAPNPGARYAALGKRLVQRRISAASPPQHVVPIDRAE